VLDFYFPLIALLILLVLAMPEPDLEDSNERYNN